MSTYDEGLRAQKVFEADLDDPVTLGARALEGIARSWKLEDPECQALALADAQVWATLRLAAQVGRLIDQSLPTHGRPWTPPSRDDVGRI